jgi:flagellar biosynthesis protein FlhG
MSGPRELSRELKDEIDRETQWSGFFLKKIREARGVSLEEMSQLTKISRTYLQCIEIEDAQRLPAQVFLRGFLTQYCKTLKLPVDQVLPIYLERIRKKIKP